MRTQAEIGSCTCCSAALLPSSHTADPPPPPPQTHGGSDRRSCWEGEGWLPPRTCPTDCPWKLHKQEQLQCWRTALMGTLQGRGRSKSPPSYAAAVAGLAWICRRQVSAGRSNLEQGDVELASEKPAALVVSLATSGPQAMPIAHYQAFHIGTAAFYLALTLASRCHPGVLASPLSLSCAQEDDVLPAHLLRLSCSVLGLAGLGS